MVTMESQSPRGTEEGKVKYIKIILKLFLKNIQLSLLTRSNLHPPCPFYHPHSAQTVEFGHEVEVLLPEGVITWSQCEFGFGVSVTYCEIPGRLLNLPRLFSSIY